MSRRIDIITDLETLGTGEDCPVFQIGAIAMDVTTGKIIMGYNKLCDISSFRNIEGNTLKWWLKTDKDLLVELLLNQEAGQVLSDEKKLIEDFLDWLDYFTCTDGDIHLWGNGILFDNKIIQDKCHKYGFTYPIKYYNDRDLRTIYELAAIKNGFEDAKALRKSIEIDTRIAHDGLNDAYHEAIVLAYAWSSLLDDEKTAQSRIEFMKSQVDKITP